MLIAASGSALPTADTVKLLLTRGANVEAKNKNGETALLLAASQGAYERGAIVRHLLEGHADVRVKDKHGNTPLALAAKNGFTDLLPLLKSPLAKR